MSGWIAADLSSVQNLATAQHRTFVKTSSRLYNGAKLALGSIERRCWTRGYKKLDKKSISIPEMGKILGLTKGASCYLVRQARFKTVKIGRQTRIYLDSFEEWYGGQFHYKKVNGELPGAIISKTTWSIQEVATLLGVCEDTVYQHLKRGSFKSEVVDCRTRIDKIDFQRWFNSQSYYKSLNLLPGKEDA